MRAGLICCSTYCTGSRWCDCQFSRGLQAYKYEANIPQSKLLAGEGNRAAKAGDFEEAVNKYTAAIKLYPFDHRYMYTRHQTTQYGAPYNLLHVSCLHRYFGNRSFCYDYLQEYDKYVKYNLHPPYYYHSCVHIVCICILPSYTYISLGLLLMPILLSE